MKNREDSVFIKSEDFVNRVKLEDIYFITKEDNKVKIVLKNETYKVNTTLYNISQILYSNFFRGHKSYIINLNKVLRISKFTNKTYNIQFHDIKDCAYITYDNLTKLTNKIKII